MPSNLGFLQLIDGLAINPKWFMPGEGAFTVLAKIALANALDAKQICQFLGVRPNRIGGSPHARSLLHLDWLTYKNTAPQLSADLCKRGLPVQVGGWVHSIASDRALRYCPACLASGYQSSLCQLEGLERCPQHNDKILEQCPSCGGRTPPYAITAESFDTPLTCRYCHTAYAPIWGAGPGRQGSLGKMEEDSYNRLRRWLESVETLDVQWPDLVGWLADPSQPVAARKAYKRTHLIRVLARLVPLPASLTLEQSNIWTGRWPLSSEASPLQGASDITQGFICSRVAIYKSIRRHYARRVGLSLNGTALLSGYAEVVWGNDAMVVPAGPSTDPEQHGLWAWRRRFESRSHTGAHQLSLNKEMLLWPLQWTAPESAWGHFAHQCLLLDQSTARELNHAMKKQDCDQKKDAASWLELVSQWLHRLSPKARPWPYGLTAFRLPGQPGQAGDICLVATPANASNTDECRF